MLRQADARVSPIPLRRTPLGRKGHRLAVGHPDAHDLGSRCGALTRVTGQLTTRLVERPRASAQSKPSRSGQRSWPEGLAQHVRDMARAYPVAHYPRGVLVLANAPWQRGAVSTQARHEVPRLEL